MKTGTLYILATPIGNKEDITLRAIRILTEIDCIAAEDTRVASKLLKLLNIPKKQLISVNEFADEKTINHIIDRLKEGQSIAYISDAGTPGISDPGAVLVNHAYMNDIIVIPIPGVSAVTAALSVSGIRETPFVFYGFLPHKNGRKKIIENLLSLEKTIVLYESVHRIVKLLEELFAYDKDMPVMVIKELTKIYESIKQGTAEEVLDFYKNNKSIIRGEFVVIIKSKKTC